MDWPTQTKLMRESIEWKGGEGQLSLIPNRIESFSLLEKHSTQLILLIELPRVK